jgi:C_GCAxxG_C_C family probable redox protein
VSDVRHAQARDGARERYTEGCNCAQSVIGALAETPGMPSLPPSIGAGYTSGIGHQGCVCGALAGGVAVLGEYAAVQGLEPVATRQLAEGLSAALYTRFAERFGAACCRTLKRGQTEGSDAWLSECATITEETAWMVAAIVADHDGAETRGRWTGRDAMSVARRMALDGLAGGAIALAAAFAVPATLRPAVFSATVVAFAVVGLVLELGGAGLRRAGRVLRAAGVTAAALLALIGLFTPGSAAAIGAAVFAPWIAGVVVRAVLALSLLIVAGSALFALKRNR